MAEIARLVADEFLADVGDCDAARRVGWRLWCNGADEQYTAERGEDVYAGWLAAANRNDEGGERPTAEECYEVWPL